MPAAKSSTREALEMALVADPDDVALHSAYADLLTEEGDPRGEYIRLQLLLEDREQPVELLRAWEQQAHEIRTRHEHEWSNGLVPMNQAAAISENCTVTWKRGWIDRLDVGYLTTELASIILHAPTIRLLRHLSIHGDGFTHWDTAMKPMLNGPIGRSLVQFCYGQVDVYFDGEDVRSAEWSAFCSRTELPRLRVFHCGIHFLGTEGLQELVKSHFFPQLRELDLSYCDLTDDAADILVQCPTIHTLTRVRLEGNHFTPTGIAVLRSIGIDAGPQLGIPGLADEYD